MRTGAMGRSSALLACCVALTSCLGMSGPDCRDETRALTASARLASVLSEPPPSDTGRAQLTLYEARNYRTKSTSAREIMWFVGSGLVRSGVSAVHVHEQGTDRLLFTIPLDSTHGPPFVITQVFTRVPYTGSVDWNELYDLVGTERTYVDVHTVAHPEGQLRGVLRPENRNGQTFTHAYCS